MNSSQTPSPPALLLAGLLALVAFIFPASAQSNLVAVTASQPTASETGPVPGTFTLTRNFSGLPLTVNYSLSGTAISGNDYVSLAGSITFDATATSTNIIVLPIPDALSEPTETVILVIVAGAGYQVGAPGSATVNILDPAPPTFTNCPASTNLGSNPAIIPDCDPNVRAVDNCGSPTNLSCLLVSSSGSSVVKRYNAATGAFMDDFASGSGLNSPQGVVFGPDGNLYVCSQNSVLRYNGTNGAFIGTFASGGGLTSPQGLVFGPDGNLYVCSQNSVLRYNGTNGVLIGTFASGGGINLPRGLTFGPDGNLYVCSQNSVLRYNGTTGAFIGTFASGGGLISLRGLVFGADGKLYVCSQDTVRRYNGATGAFIDTFASGAGLSSAIGLVFGPDGNLYVSSFGDSTVKRYNGTTGAFIDNFASGGGLASPTYLIFTPTAQLAQVTCAKVDTANGCTRTRTITYTAVDSCNRSNTCTQVITWTVDTLPPIFANCPASTNLGCNPAAIPDCDSNVTAYVNYGLPEYLLVSSYSGSSEVKRYNATTGVFIDNFISEGALNLPRGLVLGPDGNLYVCSAGTDSVLRYNAATGAFMNTFASGGGLNQPFSLAFGPDGNLYVCSGSTSVKRYNGTTGVFMGDFITVGHSLYSLAFGPDGNLYVSSYTDSGVSRYNGTTGAFMDNFVTGGSGGLANPYGLVFGPDGKLYVCSSGSAEIKRYHGTTGAFVDTFASGGGLSVPSALVFGPDGNLYVTGLGSSEVKRYHGTTGAFMDNFSSGGALGGPAGLLFTHPTQSVPVTCAKLDTTNGCVRTRTITYTAVDSCGHSNSCTQVIAWMAGDITPPVLTCASNKTVSCGSGWSFNLPTVSDACSGTNAVITVLGTVTNGICPQLVTRTWLVTDPCGNTNSCSQIVTVINTTPPVLACASNKTVTCSSNWSFDPPAASGCGGINVTISVLGTVTNGVSPQLITRTWLATDSCGNNNACSQTVTIQADTIYTWTTLAGLAGSSGSADGTGNAARFYYPYSVAVDSVGNVYVGDHNNYTIRKITPAGVVTTLAGLAGSYGTTDGTGSAARFNVPLGVAVDSAGNVYVADSANTIRKVTPAGVVTTLAGLAGSSGSADGTGNAARFNAPYSVAVDNAGNVYVGDHFNNTIRKVTLAGAVTTLAGLAGVTGSADGTGNAARFYFPDDVAVDGLGNVYVADGNNHTIRKVTPAGVVTTLAGLAGNPGSADGTGNTARFNVPAGVAVDAAGNVYVTEFANYTIRQVTPAGVVTTLGGLAGIAGSADGIGSAARFNVPGYLTVDSVGNLYVADSGNLTIRKGMPSPCYTPPILTCGLTNSQFDQPVPSNDSSNGWASVNIDGNGGWRSSSGNPGGVFILNDAGQTNSDPMISQTVCCLTTGQCYTIRGQRKVHVALGNTAPSFAVLVDGVRVLVLSAPNPVDAAWHDFAATFTATQPCQTISFAAEIDGTDVSYYLDNISWAGAGPGEANFVTLVGSGAVWKYWDQGSNLGTAWQTNYDDSAWNAGPAELGYGDALNNPPRPEATVVNSGPPGAHFITTYFRRSFVISSALDFTNLTVQLLRDDGGVVYLNGVEVFRSNLHPTNTILFNTLALGDASDDGTVFVSTNINPDLLVAGTNIVAVEIHQASAASDDLSFDLVLTGYLAPPEGVVMVSNNENSTVTNKFTGGLVQAGDKLSVGIYYGPDGETNESNLYLISVETTNLWTGPGWFLTGPQNVPPSAPAGQAAMFQVRVWETSFGDSYGEALTASPTNCRRALTGKSEIMRVFPCSAAAPPSFVASLLQPFCVAPLPCLQIVCPPDMVVVCRNNDSEEVFFTIAATNVCCNSNSVVVVCTPPSGSLFPPGTNLVHCVATDSAGNTDKCSFNVIVINPPPVITDFNPKTGGPGTIITIAGSGFGLESDDLSAVLSDGLGGLIGLRVLGVTGTEIMAEVLPFAAAANGVPHQLHVQRGDGRMILPPRIPSDASLVVLSNVWLWADDAMAGTVAPQTFAPVYSPTPTPSFFSGAPAGGQLTVTLDQNWTSSQAIQIHADIWTSAGKTETIVPDTIVAVSGTKQQCAQRVCDYLRQVFASHPAQPLNVVCAVTTDGSGNATITLTVPFQTITAGLLNIVGRPSACSSAVAINPFEVGAYGGTTFPQNVGQQVSFGAQVTGSSPVTGFVWTVEGPLLQDYHELTSDAGFQTSLIDAADFSGSNIIFYWKPLPAQVMIPNVQDNGAALSRRISVVAILMNGEKCCASITVPVERNQNNLNRQALDFYTANHATGGEGAVLRERRAWAAFNVPTAAAYDGSLFLDFQRKLLERWDAWRAEFGYGPDPGWDPATALPLAGDVEAGHVSRNPDGYGNPLVPFAPKPEWFKIGSANTLPRPANNLQADTTPGQLKLEDFPFTTAGRTLLGCAISAPWYNRVQLRVGGINGSGAAIGDMAESARAARDPIFWRWQRYVDGIGRDFANLPGQPPQVIWQHPFRVQRSLVAFPTNVLVEFDHAVQGVLAANLTVNGSTATTVAAITPNTYSFSGFLPPANGTVAVALSAGGISDLQNIPFQGASWQHVLSQRGADSDYDGLPNEQEIVWGTNPLDADSDDDGLPDGIETASATEPLDVRPLLTETRIFANLSHRPLGDAYLSQALSSLFVYNAGSSGADGVSIETGRAATFEIGLGAVNAVALPTGAFLQARAQGSVNGIPGQQICSTRIADFGNQLRTTFDFTAVGVATYTVEVWLNGSLVDSQAGVAGPAVTFPPVALVLSTTDTSPVLTPGVTLRLASPTAVTITGHGSVTADQIRAFPDTGLATMDIDYFTRFDLTASQIPTFTIQSESALQYPAIITPPQSQSVAGGSPVTLTVQATGDVPLHFQWEFKPTGGQNFLVIQDCVPCLNPPLVIASAQSANAGEYRVRISNPLGTIISQVATLSVEGVPIIVQPPQSQFVQPGDSASLTVMATGPGTLTYQWLINGEPLAGATQATLAFSQLYSDRTGTYQVVVSNAGGSVTSASATLSFSLPSSVTASVDGSGRLNVMGTAGNDNIQIRLKAGDPTVLEVDDTTVGSGAEFSFAVGSIGKLFVEMGDGTNVLVFNDANGSVAGLNKPFEIHAGQDDNTIIGDTEDVELSRLDEVISAVEAADILQDLADELIAMANDDLILPSTNFINTVHSNIAVRAQAIGAMASTGTVAKANMLLTAANVQLLTVASNFLQEATHKFLDRCDPSLDVAGFTNGLIPLVERAKNLVTTSHREHNILLGLYHDFYHPFNIPLEDQLDRLDDQMDGLIDNFELAGDGFDANMQANVADGADDFYARVEQQLEGPADTFANVTGPQFEAEANALKTLAETDVEKEAEGNIQTLANRQQMLVDQLEEMADAIANQALYLTSFVDEYTGDVETYGPQLEAVVLQSGGTPGSALNCDPQPTNKITVGGTGKIIGTKMADKIDATSGKKYFILGMLGDDRIDAGKGKNKLFGGGGNDAIHGGKGTDLIAGGSGDDCLYGEDGRDILLGDGLFTRQGNDLMYGGDDVDIMLGMGGDDEMHGGDKRDFMFGMEGDDTMYGDDGIDLMFGGCDNDILYGGDGHVVTNSNCNLHIGNLMVGGSEDDTLYGGDGIDLMFGSSGNDTLYGGHHIDVMFGNEGDDKMFGEKGGVLFTVNIEGVTVPVRLGNVMFGGPGADEMHGGVDLDVMFGNGGDDTMFGGDYDDPPIVVSLKDCYPVSLPIDTDVMFGGKGNDTMDGGPGLDLVFGGPGNDHLMGDNGSVRALLSGGDGLDLLFGGPDDDVMEGGAGIDLMFGGDGNDRMYGYGSGDAPITDLSDLMFGGEGNDFMDGEEFPDLMFGGPGNDEMQGDDGAFKLITLSDDLMFGGIGDDIMRGGRGIDIMFGGAGNDWIETGDGILNLAFGNDDDDTIIGGAGADILFGNGSDDRMEGHGFTDLMFGNKGNDSMDGGAWPDIMFGNDGDDYMEGGGGPDVMFGNADNDTMFGGDGPDLMFGNKGNDMMHGDGGPDLMFGNAGEDRMCGDDGPDLMFGNSGDDKMDGDEGPDLIFGNAGNDILFGNDGDDLIFGNRDNDTIYGGANADLLFGNKGNDTIFGEDGPDLIFGNLGFDNLAGGNGGDAIFGGRDADTIYGESGADFLFGGKNESGRDVLYGGADNDLISGGAGGDDLIGGDGDNILFGGRGNNTKTQNGANIGNSFAFPYCAEIHGTKWLDLNANGVRDSGEPGLGGILITAQCDALQFSQTDTTDASGDYSFTGLKAGIYTVSENSAGYVQTFPDDDYLVELCYADLVSNLDFGNAPCIASAPTITTATANCQSNQICLTFSRPVVNGSCTVGPANFRIIPNVGISSIALAPDKRSACLMLSQPMFPGIVYELAATGLCNQCSQPAPATAVVAFECALNDCLTILCPSNMVVACTSPGGTPVNFSVTATNRCGPAPSVQSTPASGSKFQYGTTVVTSVATDSAGHQHACSFTVTVIDKTAPMILCPTNIVAFRSSTNGAIVNFSAAVTDNCDTNVALVYSRPSGSLFLLGDTEVCATATDASGNRDCCCFTVRVLDEPPHLAVVVSGTALAVSVPFTFTPFSLETATGLGPNAVWTLLSGTNLGGYQFNVPMTEPARFFRLRGIPPPAPPDMLQNGGFVAGLQGWTVAYGTPVLSAGSGFRDAGSLQLSGSKTNGSALQQILSQSNNIVQSRHYLLSCYARFVPAATNPVAAFVKVRAFAFNGVLPATGTHPVPDTNIAILGVSGPIASTNWTLVKLPVWLANKNFSGIAIAAEHSSNTLATVQLDNLSLTEVIAPNPCNSFDAAPLDQNGNVVFPAAQALAASANQSIQPAGITISAPIYEEIDQFIGNVRDLYGSQYNVDGTALWYPTNYPGWSIGGLLSSNITASLSNALIDLDVTNSGPEIIELLNATSSNALDNAESSIPAFETLGAIPNHTPINNFVEDTNSPFGGRDIIFVHGFRTGPLFSRLMPWNCFYQASKARWPEDAAEFYEGGYWKKGADDYWRDHIESYLKGRGYKNRYLIVAHPVTQTFDYGVHAVLSQISAAMRLGTDVQLLNPGDLRGTGNFGEGSYVVISHSAGALLGDIMLAVADKTKTDPILASKLGNIGYISDGCKTHISLQGAICGSHIATAALAALDTCSVSGLWEAATDVQALFKNALPATEIRFIARNSQCRDMCPLVAQEYWGKWVNAVPCPVLTVIGGHPTASGVSDTQFFPFPLNQVIKNLILAGYDDGVLNFDSQAGNPNSVVTWPSGFDPIPATGSQNLIDRGISEPRWTGFYMDQVIDPITYGGPPRAASGAIPFLSPSGMVQPVASYPPRSAPYSPLNRYHNHYSFLQTASDHFWGPLGAQGDTDKDGNHCTHYDQANYEPTKYIAGKMSICDPSENRCGADTDILGFKKISDDTNNEETSAITDTAVFAPGAGGTPLVSPSMKFLTEEYVRGQTVTFTVDYFGNSQTFTWWVWKRTYHLLKNYKTMNETDYVYRYVLKP